MNGSDLGTWFTKDGKFYGLIKPKRVNKPPKMSVRCRNATKDRTSPLDGVILQHFDKDV